MADGKRPWRLPESYEAERATRDAVAPCLIRCGFTEVKDTQNRSGSAITQTVSARSPSGDLMIMRVKLCWRLDRGSGTERKYSAFQISASLTGGDWEATVTRQASNYQAEGNTHVLAIQPGPNGIQFAAAIPCEKLADIWRSQDALGQRLIERGEAGKLTKSPARNGQSPTLYLMDDRTAHTHAIPDALWSADGVINVLALEGPHSWSEPNDDSWADCVVDLGPPGRDAGAKLQQMRSGFRRSQRVRADVLIRAGGRCEREECGVVRDFPHFLDVHHILGISRSDRPWTCVALCPNCHREAHFAPDAEQINEKLKHFAARYIAP